MMQVFLIQDIDNRPLSIHHHSFKVWKKKIDNNNKTVHLHSISTLNVCYCQSIESETSFVNSFREKRYEW